MEKRKAIIEVCLAEISAPRIIRQLKVAKSTVYDTIKRYKELGNKNDRLRTGRPRTARTPKKIKAVRERIKKTP